MIKIIAKNYSQAVKYICDQCEQEAAHFDVFLSNDSVSVKSFLKETIGVKGIILIGNVGEWSTLFADTFGLPMFYDKYAEKNILQYCKLSQTAVPPQHGRCIVGNSGVWFQQPLSEVMIFEEFAGQIQLQRMLQYLDPYPLALEIKGGMRPAMYKTVIITSNTSPRFWYSVKDDSNDPKRMDAIHALWDRIGYSDGSYVPVRTCGTYLEAPAMMEAFGMSAAHYIQECRRYFFEHLHEVVLGYEAIYTTDEEDN